MGENPSVSPEHILQTGLGFWASKTLLSAVELGVFTTLADGPLDGDALRARIGVHERSARDFFDALVALGMLTRGDDGRYANTPATDLYLDSRKPTYVGGLLEMMNARLYRRSVRQAKTLQLLNEISRELTSILDLDCLLQRIGELLHQVIDYHMFGILLVDESGHKLVHRFAVRFDKNVQIKDVMCIGQGLVGYAAEHKEAVLAPDVTRDPRYVMLNPESRSELCVPMILKDRVIGVLDLEHTKRGYFTDFHQRTLTTLAAQIAVAIENARLFREIEDKSRQLEVASAHKSAFLANMSQSCARR